MLPRIPIAEVEQAHYAVMRQENIGREVTYAG